ncbi:MAG: ABC transporter permease [Sarcina sp.]
MKSLIEFEMKKFINRKKNLCVIILFILLSLIFVSLNLNLGKKVTQSEKTSIELDSKSIKEALTNIESELKIFPDNQNLKNIKSDYEKDLSLLEKMIIAYSKNDFQSYLKCKIELDKKLLLNIENNNVLSGESIDDIKQTIKINTTLLEKNIAPINTNLSMEGFNFIRLFLNSPISIIIAILIIVLSADSMSSEFDSNTYKLLFTQPISKIKILLSKMLATLIMVYSIILGIIFMFFLILGFKNGFGNINYPLPFYNNGSVDVIEMGNFIGFELILLVILIAFISILSISISIFSKSNSSSLTTSIIIVVAAYMFSKSGFGNAIAHINPFVYLDITNAVQGTSAILYANNHITFQLGVITIGFLTILLTAFTIMCFQRNIIFFDIKKNLTN